MVDLTELEGAVLSEIHHRERRTAFQVRKAFEESPSTEWSGSSGAVYPAIRRLTERGLVKSQLLPSKRRASHLTLTENGVQSLIVWATDPGRSIGVGLDPFRLRSGIWMTLPVKDLRLFLRRVRQELDIEISQIETNRSSLDAVEMPRASWALLLQHARRDWIDEELARLTRSSRLQSS